MVAVFAKRFLLFGLVYALFFSGAAFAQVYGISLSTDKFLYGAGETAQLSGYVSFVNNTISTPISSGNISISLENSSLSPVSADSVLPISSGYFNSTVSAPSTAGTYFIRAKYTDSNGTLWQSAISFRVTSVSIDAIFLRPNKADYSSGEAVSIVIEPVRELSTGYTSLPDVEVYGSLRYANGTVIQPFGACAETGTNRTGSLGSCTVSVSAPPVSGTYLVEANDFVGSNTISVIPFDATVSIKDGTGSYLQSIFSGAQSGKVVVSITQNGSLPASGSYYFSGNISDSNGTVAIPVARTNISNSTYSGSYSFTTGNLSVGTYSVSVLVSKVGGETVSQTTFFDVRTWSLSVDKLSGFASAYNAFPSSPISFSISATDLSTGGSIILNANNTNVSLFNKVGTKLASYNPVWNSTLNVSVASFNSPAAVGAYTLSVSVTSSGVTRTMERTFKVIDVAGSAVSTDSERQVKDLFGGSESVYVLVSASNSAGDVAITDAEIAEIRDENGNKLNYTNTSWSSDSNASKEWRVNITGSSAFFKIDNPQRGGLYSVKIYVNERSAVATAKFVVDPYRIFAVPKGENDDSGWGRWQFSTRDKVFFTVTVTNANHKSGSAKMEFEDAYGGGAIASGRMMSLAEAEGKTMAETPSGGGGGSSGAKGSAGASSSANAVVNATVEFEEIANDMIMQSVPLSTLNVSCTRTDSNGQADCSVIPAGGKWDGGWYHVVFRVTGSDNSTSGIGHSGFEARSFYITGYTYDPTRSSSGMGWWDGKWMHKPSDNVSIKVYMFDAGNAGWWGYYAGGDSTKSSAGLSGTIAVEKILYRGSPGEWLWPPVTVSTSDYSTSGTGTVSSGQGNLTVTPTSRWKTGSYSVILRGTKTTGNESETDYGEIWFEVRQWDAWASPVNTGGSGGDIWRSAFNVRENVTLYVNIRNAGSWNYYMQENLTGAPVTIGIRKIEDFSSWPPQELDASAYSYAPITVSKSSPDMWMGGGLNLSYVLTLVPTSGRWNTGYYNVILDLNGTETGYGWFNAISFYSNAQFVDAGGSSIWTSRGGADLYFNVTTTLNPYYGWGTPAGLINTTVKEVKLSSFSEGNWMPTEYSFVPGASGNDFNVTPTAVNGQQKIQLTKAGGWGNGWYNGEIVLQDSGGSTSTAWIWFQIKPFEVSAYTTAWEVSSRTALNVSLDIIQDWNACTWGWDPVAYTSTRTCNSIFGNYTVDSVKEMTWGYMGPPSETEITGYSPTGFNGSTDLIIPPNGSWSAGYHNLVISVHDNESNAGTTWVSFNVVPFAVDIVNEKWSYRSGENVSVNVTVRTSSAYGSPLSYANVSKVVEKDWSTWPASESELTFSVASANASGNLVNGTGALIINPPSGGWEQKYHNLEIQFVDSDSGGSPVTRWVYFDVRSYDAWAYPVDLNTGWWTYGFGKSENATLKLEVYEPTSDYYSYVRTPGLVNVTKVEYRKSYDWTAPYTEATYSINGTSTHGVNGTGFVIISPPSGGWDEGSYEGRITVSGSEGTAQAYIWFQVIDRTPPGVSIISPLAGEYINESSSNWPVMLLVETTKLASCDYQTNSMGWRYYGFSYRQTNHSITIPESYLSSNGNSTITVYCHDDSWNENSTSVTFYLNISTRGAPPRANITYPANGATNVSLSPTITVMLTKRLYSISYSSLWDYLSDNYVELNFQEWDSGLRLTFTPYSPLSENTTYIFTIYSGADSEGNYLEGAPISINFTTAAGNGSGGGDTTAPSILNRVPAIGAINVPVNTNITAVFSEPINTAALNFTLLEQGGSSAIAGSLTWNFDNTALSFTPSSPLNYNKTHYVYIENISDLAGNNAGSSTYTFTTIASSGGGTPPVVLGTYPANASTNVPVSGNASINVTFDRSMNDTSVSVSVNPSIGSGVKELAGTSYRFRFSAPFASSTTYLVTVTGNDTNGTPMVPYVFSFTTASGGGGPQELLTNRGFEILSGPNQPVNWTIYTNMSIPQPQNRTYVDNTTNNTGSNSISAHSDRGLILQQNVTDFNVAGGQYNVSLFLRRSSSSPGIDGHAIVFKIGYVNTSSAFSEVLAFPANTPHVDADNAFYQFKNTLTMPPDAANITSFFVEKIEAGQYWIDDVSLRRVG